MPPTDPPTTPIATPAATGHSSRALRLTSAAQELAVGRLRRLYRLNPIGSNLMMGPVLFLMALDDGAGDLVMGLLYAGGYLAGAVALLVPWLCARVDPARLTIGAWWGRALCGVPYLALPFVAAPGAKVAVLTACFLAFAAVRMVGIIALNVATAAYVGGDRRPQLIAFSHVWYNTGVLLSTVLGAAVLFWRPGEGSYVGILILGVATTAAAARAMHGLPAVGVRAERLRPLPWRDPGLREALRATVLVVPQAVAATYQLSALKVGQGLGAGAIFALTVAGLGLAIVATRWLTRALPRLGLARVQVGVHALLALTGVAWAFSAGVPAPARTGFSVALYILSQPLLAMSLALMSALQVDRLPARGVVGASALIQMVGAASGALAVLLIWVMGAWPWERLPGAGSYAHAFLLWAACSLGICILGLSAGRAPAAVEDLATVNDRE
jgi:hypothetical protein